MDAHIATYTNDDGTALARLLDRNGVRLTKVGTPVTTTDGDDGQLGDDNSGADGSGDFLGGLDAETDVALRVTDNDDAVFVISVRQSKEQMAWQCLRLEASTLTGTGLLLDRLDLHNLILELGQEEVNDLVLLHWQTVQVDPVALSVSSPIRRVHMQMCQLTPPWT